MMPRFYILEKAKSNRNTKRDTKRRLHAEQRTIQQLASRLREKQKHGEKTNRLGNKRSLEIRLVSVFS
jgi:hypothetical protein